jgi:hypothetical protein
MLEGMRKVILIIHNVCSAIQITPKLATLPMLANIILMVSKDANDERARELLTLDSSFI